MDKISIWRLYLEALWPHLWGPLLGPFLFGFPEVIARFSERFRKWMDKVPQETRWIMETLTLSVAIFYAGFGAWDDERANLSTAEKNRIIASRPFLGVREIYREVPRLGNPVSDVITAVNANIEVHENAVILWIEPLNAIIRLNTDEKHSFNIYEDQTNKVDPDLFDDDKLRSWLGLPHDCAPPTGGVAVLAHANQPEWKGIGCRTWKCDISSIKYQEFENGYVISGVPKFSTAQINRSFFLENIRTSRNKKMDQYIRNEFGRWHDKTLQEEIPLCSNPRT